MHVSWVSEVLVGGPFEYVPTPTNTTITSISINPNPSLLALPDLLD